jgi:hypothetical protein
MSGVRSNRQIWGAPIALGVLSLVGLVAALVADGLGDVVSWVALAVPAAICLRGWLASKPASSDSGHTPRRAARPVRPVAVRRSAESAASSPAE